MADITDNKLNVQKLVGEDALKANIDATKAAISAGDTAEADARKAADATHDAGIKKNADDIAANSAADATLKGRVDNIEKDYTTSAKLADALKGYVTTTTYNGTFTYTSNAKNYAVQLDKDGKAFVNVPWSDTVYTLPIATATVLGGVKQGKNVTIAIDGTLSIADPFTADVTAKDAENVTDPNDNTKVTGIKYYVQKDADGHMFVTVPVATA